MPKDPKALHTAHQWLVAAGERLGVSSDALTPVIPDLLDLTRDVAHGPSRPAAPLTAFLVGLAAGQDGSADASVDETVDAVRAKIAGLQPLLENWGKVTTQEADD